MNRSLTNVRERFFLFLDYICTNQEAIDMSIRSIALPTALSLPLVFSCTPSNDKVESFYPEKNSKGINPDTHIVINFKDSVSAADNGFIRVYDITTKEYIDSLDLSLPAGLTESRKYPADCDYTKVPYDYSPRTFIPTNRNTVPGTPSGTAEPTPRDMQLTIIGGFTDGFRFHPVIVNGSTATIYLHNNVLEYGHKYRVEIDKEVFGEEIRSWSFQTKKNGPKDIHNLTVNCDGSGDFSTVQGALDAVKDADSTLTTIRVAAGDYEEIVYARCKTNIGLAAEPSPCAAGQETASGMANSGLTIFAFGLPIGAVDVPAPMPTALAAMPACRANTAQAAHISHATRLRPLTDNPLPLSNRTILRLPWFG